MKAARTIITTLTLVTAGALIFMTPMEGKIFASTSAQTSAPDQKPSNADSPRPVKDWSVVFPEDPAKPLAVGTCGSCHGLSQVVTRRGDKSFWSDIVYTMVSNGADIQDEDAAKLIKYFSTYLDPSKPMLPEHVDINTASVEILRLLSPLASHAEDIVRTRDELKGFKKLEDLLQVNGLTREDFDKVRPFISVGP